MPGNRGRNYHRHRTTDRIKPKVGDNAREALQLIGDDNVVIQMFKKYSSDLDKKHDRYERLVKLSRDITIESKRIIFLLHNTDTDIFNKKESIFSEADLRLNMLIEKSFKAIALELDGLDAYLYLRAYTSGLQEFVEALTFCSYLKTGNIQKFEEINKMFQYNIEETPDEENTTTSKTISLLFPYTEFILGLADFTGELMRKCINNLGDGNIDDCFKICNYVKYILVGFLGVNTVGYKEIGRKLYVLKQSLAKMETVCYNIKVRGSEIPKHMLAHVINSADVHTEEDEGFY